MRSAVRSFRRHIKKGGPLPRACAQPTKIPTQAKLGRATFHATGGSAILRHLPSRPPGGAMLVKKADWHSVRRPTARPVGTQCHLNERLYIFAGEDFRYRAGAT